MFTFYFKMAWRNLINNKFTSIISITGLSLGMAAAVLILIWVQNELNFDSYHLFPNRIYHVLVGHSTDKKKFGGTPMLLAETAQQQIPEIENTTRLFIPGYARIPILGFNNNYYKEKNLVYVDKEWFNVFHYAFVAGDGIGFSQNTYGVIMTESFAKKYFGNTNAIGQKINVDSNTYQVRAIIKDNPPNSSFQFSIFLPLEAYLKYSSPTLNSWQSFDCQTFLKLKENQRVAKVEEKMDAILLNRYQARILPVENGKTNIIHSTISPLSNIHFDNSIGDDQIHHGDKRVVFIFSILGILLLIIACINYVNLTTAKASLRSKEVSIKKILGANKKSLFAQFIAESFFTSVIALILTLLIAWLCLPWFNNFSEKHFQLSLTSPGLWKILSSTLAITVLITGIYPALLLASFKPLDILRGFNVLKVKNTSLRKVLVTSQFIIAVALIISTIVILKQLHFIQDNNEGYNRNQVFSVALPSSWSAYHKNLKKNELINILKNELTRETTIENVTVSNDAIQNLKMSMGGVADWTGKDHDIDPSITPLAVDANFRDIFKLRLKEGRWFQPNNLNDRHNYILNETAVSELGLKEPYIGQYFSVFGDTGQIIGVVHDFHYRDYHQKIGASVLFDNPAWAGTFFIQTPGSKTKKALAKVETIWKLFFSQEPFEYSFMDEEFENMYKGDIKTSKLIGLFAGMAIFISCLGLFGLVSFTAEQRKKEIGIRKVLGASIKSITVLLSKDFIKLVSMAVVIASPIAWWAMNKWIENFAYRIRISWWFFLLAGIIALLIALITVSYHAIKAALANPVKNLRTE